MPFKVKEVVSKTNSVNPEDIVTVKQTLNELGYYEGKYPSEAFVDKAMFSAIEDFQKDNGLKVDGIIKPGGPTEKTLNDKTSFWDNPITGPVYDFINNYNDSKENKNADKYFHCKANYQAAKRGEYGSMLATMGSLGKEIFDLVSRRNDLKEVISDLNADSIGWQGGKNGLSLQDACGTFRTKKVSEKY